jgi:hypothetical protein
MLFATWVAAPFRPTRDLDLLGYGENSPEVVREAFREICGQQVTDDGVAFDIDGIEAVLADLERFLLPLLETTDGSSSWNPRAGWVRRIG